MCGIVGYVGPRPVQEVLLAGLEKLEYRGYDSAGISIQSEGRLDSVRAVGNLSALRSAVETTEGEQPGAVAVAAPPATTGIGHTRWATHGRVSEDNAHPHFDEDNRVHIVVNGIVENFMELKHELLAAGVEFTSDTDVEVMAHLIARYLDETDDLPEAVRRAYNRLRGHYALVAWARVPVEMDIASEYRYRNPIVGPGDLVIGITQSGETADTLAAMRLARSRGANVIAVTNIMGSQATREADGVLFTRSGLEISVAATKTFTAQVAAMYLLALRMAELRGTLPPERLRELIAQVKRLPHAIAELLDAGSDDIDRVAERFRDARFFLYLGRHVGLPVCLEGALKLKEISYTATDAYAAGEMKHGPIALLDEGTPVVVVATESPVLDKVISNMQEVRARGAAVIAVGGERARPHADAVLTVPEADWMLQPLLAVIPLQLLAYRIARLRGLNVDQPRNLAKTVTVE